MRQANAKFSHGQVRLLGWVFIGILIPSLLAAWNTGTNLLYLVVGGIISFLLISVFLAYWTLRSLRLFREAPRAVHRGDTMSVLVRVENRKLLIPSISLRIVPQGSRTPVGFILKVPARQAAQVNVQHVFPRRGIYPLPNFMLKTSFPFGLIERSRLYTDNHEVVVYPRVRTLRTSLLDQSLGSRYTTATPSPDGDEFFSLREYVRGDDPRRIAWRLSARMGTWMIRELAKENTRFIVLALDTRRIEAEHHDEEFEEAVELTASLGITLLKRQYNVAVITPDSLVEHGEGSGHEREILEMLARAQPLDPRQHLDFEARVRQLESQRAAVLFLSPDNRRWGQRDATGQFRVLDPREVLHA